MTVRRNRTRKAVISGLAIATLLYSSSAAALPRVPRGLKPFKITKIKSAKDYMNSFLRDYDKSLRSADDSMFFASPYGVMFID